MCIRDRSDAAGDRDATRDAGNVSDAGLPGDSACYGPLARVLFCDGFEAPGLPGWTSYFHDGRADRITTGTFRGTGALRSRNSLPGGGGAIYVDALGGRTSGHLYLRAYLYVPSSYAAQGVSALVLGESVQPLGGLSLVLYDCLLYTSPSPRDS